MAKENEAVDYEFDISSARLVPGSLVHQMVQLGINECMAKPRMPDPTTTMDRLADELVSMREQLRNGLQPSIRRAKEVSGYNFRCEIGEVIMPGGTFYLVAVVTRTA